MLQHPRTMRILKSLMTTNLYGFKAIQYLTEDKLDLGTGIVYKTLLEVVCEKVITVLAGISFAISVLILLLIL